MASVGAPLPSLNVLPGPVSLCHLISGLLGLLQLTPLFNFLLSICHKLENQKAKFVRLISETKIIPN